jgi:hypothetical protein
MSTIEDLKEAKSAEPKAKAKQKDQGAEPEPALSPIQIDALRRLPTYFTNGISVLKGKEDSDTDLIVVKDTWGMDSAVWVVPKKVSRTLKQEL